MAGAGLKRQGALALLLVVLVTALCLSQRLGLLSHCPQQPGSEILALTEDSGQCSLSEQLLGKLWQLLESLLLGLLPLLLWFWPPVRLLRPRRRHPPPGPVHRCRRHLLLCVFRE